MLLRLHQYDVDVTWSPGKDILIAVTLSCAYAPATKIHQITMACVNGVQTINIQPVDINDMQKATADDKTLLKVVKHGWPEDKFDLSTCLQPYLSIHDGISHEKGLLLKGERSIVSTACRTSLWDSLHGAAHLEDRFLPTYSPRHCLLVWNEC